MGHQVFSKGYNTGLLSTAKFTPPHVRHLSCSKLPGWQLLCQFLCHFTTYRNIFILTMTMGYVVKSQYISSIKNHKQQKKILYKLVTPNLCDSYICKFYINMISYEIFVLFFLVKSKKAMKLSKTKTETIRKTIIYVFSQTQQCLLFHLVATSFGHCDHHQAIATKKFKKTGYM